MVKLLNKCILSILVYNLFLGIQRKFFFIHRYISCLHEIEIKIFKKYGYLIGRKNRFKTLN